MAVRDLRSSFYIHNITMALRPVRMIPTFISCLWNGFPRMHSRFVCSHHPPETNMLRYREKFAQRMAMAGLKLHHRIAIAVSGGPDSIALCVLTGGWKTENFDDAIKGSKPVEGLLAIVVDHGLRTESAEEANLVRRRVLDMGIKCEVARCEWLDGRPKLGHLQEAARNKRYETLQRICFKQQIGILLIAHHADDQAELFILRLSRISGVLGLAGMAFTSKIFSEFTDFSVEESKAHGILLVRPLLEFSKEDMYNICQGGNQQWVEDPTNRSPLYARNRIRMALSDLSSLIKLCRTYSYSERKCYATNELEQIERNIEANLDKILPDVSRVPFLGATSSESVLIEAKRIDILSDSSHKAIVSLQKQESEKFIKSKAETISDSESQDNITYSGSKSISPGQVGFFMNRFLLD
ncbi:hypothetical protein ACS0TY_022497 [Phlomoides rotata]